VKAKPDGYAAKEKQEVVHVRGPSDAPEEKPEDEADAGNADRLNQIEHGTLRKIGEQAREEGQLQIKGQRTGRTGL
jgi:hypothetical protein